MGFVIESPRLANAVSSWLDHSVEGAAYEVILARNGNGLEWVERTSEGEVYYSSEPKTGFWRRFGVG
jgi:putative cardiolipin synthase